MTSRLSTLALLVSLGAVLPAYAQPAHAEEASPPSPQAREIVVTGRGLPDTPAKPAYDVKILDREQLLATGSGRIEDALSSIAGFQQFRRSDSRSSNPSAQGVTLRSLGGNASSRTLMLLDGVPVADPFFGYIPYSALAPEQLDSIRVTRGGGSGAFGAGAVAGTIELESADAATLGLVQGSLLVNDRGETEASASLAPELGQGFAVVHGRWDRGKGFYTTPKSQRVPATARAKYDSWSAGARVVQPLTSDIEVQARALFFEDHRTLRFKDADSSSKGQDISLRLVGRGEWQFDVIGYAQWRNFTNMVISSTAFKPTLDQYDTPSTGLGGKIEVRPPVGPDHVLRLGVDYRRTRARMKETAYNAGTGAVTANRLARGVSTDLGFFAENDWTLGPVVLTGGIRLDHYTIRNGSYRQWDGAGLLTIDDNFANQSKWETTWRGGMMADIAPGLRARGAVYSGLRLPTLNELYRPFAVFPVITQANAQLHAEKLRGFEGGFDYTPADGISLALTAFDNKVKGAIANVTLGTNLRQRQNVDAIRAKGVEFTANADVGKLSFYTSVSYTDSKVKGSGIAAGLNGMRPSQTPKWAAVGTISYRPLEDWLISASLRHAGKQFEDDLQVNAMKSATTLDAFAQLPIIPEVSFILRGENLFNATIITRNQGGSIDLGTPRTVWAGIRFGF